MGTDRRKGKAGKALIDVDVNVNYVARPRVPEPARAVILMVEPGMDCFAIAAAGRAMRIAVVTAAGMSRRNEPPE